MDRLERFYRIHRLLKAGKCLPLNHFTRELEVSRATLKRDFEYLRDRLEAPLIYDKARAGYRYDFTQPGAKRYELPGVWFTPAEIHALLVVHALLTHLGPGLLQGTVGPLTGRLERLLEQHRLPSAELGRRIRILNVAHRVSAPQHFAIAAQAVLQRRRLKLRHYNRRDDRTTVREVSPQRLIHYRGTWYLDAWCHLRKGLRSFSLDAMQQLAFSGRSLKDVADAELEAYFAASYGIFSGSAPHTAVLRFSAGRARWVRQELWHPAQTGASEADGCYRLEFPYGDDTELVMDILRHGAEVEVLSPEPLRRHVADEARRLLTHYD